MEANIYPWWWPATWDWLWVACLGFAAVCVFFLFGYLFSGGGLFRGRADRDTLRKAALEILDHRYVRGEITRQQYDEMKNALGESRGPGPLPPLA